jgi:hypothetical protein
MNWDAVFQYLMPQEEGALRGSKSKVEIYRGLNKEVVTLSE